MKLDSSPDTDSTSENTYSPFEENSDNVTFCHCHKYKVDVTTFKDAVEIFKDDIKTLKERIYIKRRQVNTYLKIKASLSENDLMLHVDFAESYKNDQEVIIQGAYFGNQCFKIFIAC